LGRAFAWPQQRACVSLIVAARAAPTSGTGASMSTTTPQRLLATRSFDRATCARAQAARPAPFCASMGQLRTMRSNMLQFA